MIFKNTDHVSHLQLKSFNSRHQQKHGLETLVDIIGYIHVILTPQIKIMQSIKNFILHFFFLQER